MDMTQLGILHCSDWVCLVKGYLFLDPGELDTLGTIYMDGYTVTPTQSFKLN